MQYQHIADQFLLNPDITFLNFGSFGACPKPVFDNYQHWQLQLEREPVQFIAANGPKYLQQSREALAAYIGCDVQDVVYVTNPSYAINIVAKSLQLQPGDEILGTNLEYGALDRTWKFCCQQAGAVYVRQPIELPLVSKEQFIEDFFKGLSIRTKAIFISQITSATGLVFPVAEVCAIAKAKGLITIVDGAHVPGHIQLNLHKMQADFYTGACHKWMCTAKGSSFLYAHKTMQHLLKPLVVSWGWEALFPSDSQFIDHHQMQGTRDFSAFLTIPAAIDFMQQHNWPQIATDCRQLAHSNYQRFCDLLGSQPLAPITDEFLGQMCSIPINTAEPEKLQRLLYEQYKIEIPVMRQNERMLIRYSIQVFNTQQQLDSLYDSLTDIIRTTQLIKA